MNKIYLDKLCEFALTTHKNYELNPKNFDFDQIINSIKQNGSLNEKGLFLKHNFVDLKSIVPSIEYDQLVLVNPLCFNLYGNIEWFNFLNALLTVLNDNYLHESNLIKKTIIETADKTYKKKIMVENKFSDKIIENVSVLTNIALIIINSSKIKIYNCDKNKEIKVVVLLNYNEQYYPLINWSKKYFDINSQFVSYLIDKSLTYNSNQSDFDSNKSNDFIKVSNKKNKKNIEKNLYDKNLYDNNLINGLDNKKHKNKLNTIFDELDDLDDLDNLDNLDNFDNLDNLDELDELDKFNLLNKKDNLSKVNNNNNNKNTTNNTSNEKIDNKKDCYEELTTNENYAIYISEAIDNNLGSNKNLNVDNKKKNKKGKNIFVVNQNNDIQKENLQVVNHIDVVKDDTSIFAKTEKITKKDIDDILNNLKPTLNLEQIQLYAIKLQINIFDGATKSGKPKNKTKSDLIDDIKKVCKKY